MRARLSLSLSHFVSRFISRFVSLSHCIKRNITHFGIALILDYYRLSSTCTMGDNENEMVCDGEWRSEEHRELFSIRQTTTKKKNNNIKLPIPRLCVFASIHTYVLLTSADTIHSPPPSPPTSSSLIAHRSPSNESTWQRQRLWLCHCF